MSFTVGRIVTHIKRPAWGLGKILRLDGDQALVFFVEGVGRDGTSKNPVKLLTSFLLPSPVTSHPVLDNLAPLDGDSVTSKERYVSLAQAKRLFRQRHPAGFTDPAYVRDERDYKWRAHEECRTLLDPKALEELLDAGDHGEVARRALRVTSMVNLPTPWDHMAMADGLREPAHQEQFALALRELLHGEGTAESRFTAFGRVLDHLPRKQTRVLTWPNQTILPFLWDPKAQMFMKPTVTRAAAARCAFDLKYQADPNWATYQQLLRLTEVLFAGLDDLGPRDNIDIQSFIWLIGELT